LHHLKKSNHVDDLVGCSQPRMQWRGHEFYRGWNFFFIAKRYFLPADNCTFPVDPKILRYYLIWKPKSLAKSAGNVFHAEFIQKSTGKVRSSNNGWACYKESRSWAWASAQASWGVAPPLGGCIQGLCGAKTPHATSLFLLYIL